MGVTVGQLPEAAPSQKTLPHFLRKPAGYWKGCAQRPQSPAAVTLSARVASLTQEQGPFPWRERACAQRPQAPGAHM